MHAARRLIVRVSTLLLSAACLSTPLATAVRAADLPEEAAAAIAGQKEALDGIATLRAKATVVMIAEDGTKKPMQEVEWRRAGKNERFETVTLLSYQMREDGTSSLERLDPAMREVRGYTKDELRNLEGWDPDVVADPPLRPTPETIANYVRIYGTIGKRGDHQPILHGQLLLVPSPMHDLTQLAETVREVKVVSKTDEALTLDFAFDELFAMKNGRVTIALSPKQNYLIRRVEWRADAASPDPTTVTEAEIQDFGEGRFLPTKVTTAQGGKILMEVSLTDVAIDGEFDPATATVRFPEGSKVDRYDGQKTVAFYIWGKNAPAETFETSEARERWLYDQVRGAQRE